MLCNVRQNCASCHKLLIQVERALRVLVFLVASVRLCACFQLLKLMTSVSIRAPQSKQPYGICESNSHEHSPQRPLIRHKVLDLMPWSSVKPRYSTWSLIPSYWISCVVNSFKLWSRSSSTAATFAEVSSRSIARMIQHGSFTKARRWSGNSMHVPPSYHKKI